MKVTGAGVLLISIVGMSFAADSWAASKRLTHVPARDLGPADVIRISNTRLGLQFDRWSFELFGENLTDADGMQDGYWEYGAGYMEIGRASCRERV